MGTIPFPNVADEAGQIAQAPQNSLAEYARVAGLKQQTQQAQAMAPGQLQQQQQQIEAQKRQFADQDATTKAFLNWNHKDPNDLATSVVQNGGSGAAAQAIQQHFLGIQKTSSDIAKQDAETGSKVLDTKIARHNQTLGQLSALDDVSDAELPQQITAHAQQLSQSTDPDERNAAQHLAAIAQLPAQQARQQMKVIEHGLMGEKEIFEQNQKAAEEEQKNWKEAGPGTLINIKTGETKQGNMPVDQQEMHSYLTADKVPGETLPPSQRTPASFVAWKAKQNPMAMVMGNMLQCPAIDQAAERYSKDGTLPSGFARSPGTTAAIIQRSAALHPEQDLASNKATFQADTGALKQVQKQFDTMNAFEGTALKNLDLYAQTAAKIPDLGAKFANVPLRMITGSMIGTDNMAALNAAHETASTEVAKVLGSATGSGVLSDSQKKDAKDVIDGNLPFSATMAVVNTLKKDMANRHVSYQQDIDAIKGRLGAKPAAAQSATQQSGATNPKTGAFSWDAMPKHQ